MKLRLRVCLAAAIAAATLLICAQARASVIMTLEQVGPSVVATGSGTLDIADLSYFGSSNAAPFIFPADAVLLEGSSSAGYNIYSGLTGPSNFGGGPHTAASSGTGDAMAIDGAFNIVVVPVGYVSGALVSSSATWDNTTLATLAVVSEVYTWTWGSGADADSLTLYAGVAAPATAPEPGSLLLVVAGTGALVMDYLKRRVGRFRLPS